MLRTTLIALLVVAGCKDSAPESEAEAEATNTSDTGESEEDGAQDDNGPSGSEPGYGNCAEQPEAAVCLGFYDEECVTPYDEGILAGSVCAGRCEEASDCPPIPPGGNPQVLCIATRRCKLYCPSGETCPDGMFCHDGLKECLWHIPGCPEGGCPAEEPTSTT